MDNRATANTIPMANPATPTVNKGIHIKIRAIHIKISSNPPTAAGHKLNRKEAATIPHEMRSKEAADMVSTRMRAMKSHRADFIKKWLL